MNELYSLSSLFDHKLLRIPDYQRGYAWQEEQLAEFWEDLANNFENHEVYQRGKLDG